MKKALLSFVLAVMLLVTFTGCDMTETLGNIAEDLADPSQ